MTALKPQLPERSWELMPVRGTAAMGANPRFKISGCYFLAECSTIIQWGRVHIRDFDYHESHPKRCRRKGARYVAFD
jgi:hypothetical protein